MKASGGMFERNQIVTVISNELRVEDFHSEMHLKNLFICWLLYELGHSGDVTAIAIHPLNIDIGYVEIFVRYCYNVISERLIFQRTSTSVKMFTAYLPAPHHNAREQEHQHLEPLQHYSKTSKKLPQKPQKLFNLIPEQNSQPTAPNTSLNLANNSPEIRKNARQTERQLRETVIMHNHNKQNPVYVWLYYQFISSIDFFFLFNSIVASQKYSKIICFFVEKSILLYFKVRYSNNWHKKFQSLCVSGILKFLLVKKLWFVLEEKMKLSP